MKVLMCLLVIASCLASFSHAQDVQALPSSMSLTQFQKVLHTFLDDEMAVVADELVSPAHEFHLSDEVYATTDDDEANIKDAESTLETMLRNRISFVETDPNGYRRRILKNHRHKHRDSKLGKSGKEAAAPNQRGRFADVDPASIPLKVNATWDGIISHAWDMAKLRSKHDASSTVSGRGKAGRGRASSAGSEEYEADDNLIEHELVTDWADESETLFIVCHSSEQSLDGNSHLKEILTAAGKDVNVMVTSESIEVVHSSPSLTCVVLSMKPTYAWRIAERGSVGTTDSSITIAPWVDVMKISPELFEQIMAIDERNIEGEIDVRQRGLYDFRRTEEANTTEAVDEEESPFWVSDTPANANAYAMEDKYIVFSLTSPSTIEDAHGVIRSLEEMAEVGQRRRTLSDMDLYSHPMSITEAFSITRDQSFGDNSISSSSAHHWSRLLESGLESDNKCITLFKRISLQASLIKSSYEFLLIPEDTMDSATYIACVASAVAGLSVNPMVLNIGIVPKHVQLDNDKAQWVLQGSAVNTNDSTSWRRPFFDAGLMGQGQVVSVSDTGLDLNNCYFKDARGNGNIFNKWDTSRRKVIRYDVSSRGGDAKDVFKGHGTHVVGTITGKHIRGRMADGDDKKEGMAPAAKLHFYDIGIGSAVNDPREGWLESFYQEGGNKGAKVASGSWGFGYRTSYDWVCRLYDQLVFDHPDVLHVASAGNTGNQFSSPFKTIGAPASCKNPFAVGATNNAEYGNGISYVVDFSSRGPTADGRTKPDIMAPGYALDSASAGFGKCAQEEPVYLKAGTSMATPVVAGASALVRQYFMHGYYPCGSKGCAPPMTPSGALVKAVLANGAQSLTGVQVGGTTTVLNQKTAPYDSSQNMGISNLLTSLPLKNENDFRIFVQNDIPLKIDQLLTFDFVINQSGCSSDFAATIAWYDPPATNGCTKCLVNDLDLVVENLQSRTKYYPNGLSKPDTVNNLERVRIDDTASGEKYRVTVTANMLGPGYSTQNVALVVTGCFGETDSSSEDRTSEPSEETPSSHNLVTTYSANRKQAGNMFAVQAKKDGIKVTSFAFHTLLSKTVRLHVYMLNTFGGITTGSEAFLSNPAAWTRISPSSGIQVEAKGFGSPTVIPSDSFEPVSIPKGRIQSFYITLIDENEMLYKAVDNNYPTGSIFSADDAIAIFSGVGKGFDFGATWQHRQMNGAVYYSMTN